MIYFLKQNLLFLYKSPKLFFRYLYKPLYVGRKKVASRYLKGSGIEIGALAFPLVPVLGSEKKYVDKLSKEELNNHFFKRYGKRIFYPDVVTDGEKLDEIAPESLDFIYTSHFLEHCQDPISTIESHLSKLKKGGRAIYVIPDRANISDKDRVLTSIEHLINDYKKPEISKMEHIVETAKKTDCLKEGTDAYNERIKQLSSMDGLIHYHVFDMASYKEFLESTRLLLKNYEIVELSSNPANSVYEHIAVIKKII